MMRLPSLWVGSLLFLPTLLFAQTTPGSPLDSALRATANPVAAAEPPAAKAEAPAASGPPLTKEVQGRTLKLVNRVVRFDGKTIALASHQQPMPDGIEAGMSVDEQGRPGQCYLLRMQGDRVLQALEIHGFSGFAVVDLAGDGGRQFILDYLGNPAAKGPFRVLMAVSAPLWVTLEYSDGSLRSRYHGGGLGSGGDGVYQLNAAGELEKAFEFNTRQVGGTSLGTYHYVWADLYGDGRPVACDVMVWANRRFDVKHTTSQELTRYWHRGAAPGTWVNETVCLPVETKAKSPDREALKGLMAPATFKPTPLMLLRDRIRRVLPAGWSASINNAAEIRVTSDVPREYVDKKYLETRSRQEIATAYGYLQKNRISLSVFMRPALSLPEMSAAKAKAAAAQADCERFQAQNDPAVLRGEPPRTPERQALLDRYIELQEIAIGCSWVEPDIVTPEWFFNVSSMSKETAFFNEADAAEFARLEKAVKEVLTGNAPKAESRPDEPAHRAPQAQP